MPIVEQATDAPLNQGDILRGVTLFATENGWNEKGGDAAKAPFKMCLVLSRPCVIAHKLSVVVAGIEKLPDQIPKELDSFHKILDFLTDMRDGGRSADTFYLGQLPGMNGRYRAKFDSLHTIGLPPTGPERDKFVKSTRIAALHIDFCRALHTRLFTAFASMGFDDHSWFSTDDLRWLVNAGETDLSRQDLKICEIQTKMSSLGAQGKDTNAKELSDAQTKYDELKTLVKPYLDEFGKRTSNRGNPPSITSDVVNSASGDTP